MRPLETGATFDATIQGSLQLSGMDMVDVKNKGPLLSKVRDTSHFNRDLHESLEKELLEQQLRVNNWLL